VPILLTSDFPPSRGGIQRYLERLAEHLQASGAQVTVVAPATEGSAASDAGRRYRVVRVPCRGRISAVLYLLGGLLFARLKAPDEVSVASSWFPAGVAAALLPRTFRGRLAVLAHGTELASRGNVARSVLMRWVFRRADIVIANSRFTARRARAAGVRGAIGVAYCGVDPATVPRLPAAEPTILSVGRLIARKGFDRTIEAVALLSERFPALRYELAGDGPDRTRLEALARDFRVTGHVRFLGEIDDAALRSAYERAWCFAMPSRTDGDDVEGFGIVYLEAAMAALPVVAGRGSGAAEAVVDKVTGLLVDPGDPHAIAAALHELLADPEHARSLGEAGRARALADFTWEHNARTVARLTGLADADTERTATMEAYA
jgi:phosphatidylinositol alpha-1,6-mannosyltransferase